MSDLQSSIMQSSNDNTPHSHLPSPQSFPPSETVQPQLPTSQAMDFSFASDLGGDFLSAEGFDFSNLDPSVLATASGDWTSWNWHLDIFDQNAGLDDIMNMV